MCDDGCAGVSEAGGTSWNRSADEGRKPALHDLSTPHPASDGLQSDRLSPRWLRVEALYRFAKKRIPVLGILTGGDMFADPMFHSQGRLIALSDRGLRWLAAGLLAEEMQYQPETVNSAEDSFLCGEAAEGSEAVLDMTLELAAV
ncbi:hypothetical protein AK812_SmicGene19663 [Symbiodinium microadriaticum]|uniref:Uncharacterized protein n=1 Tax=Symbiodinium microadriaticum TaxID=2951 RepID=A0A1Q9DS03_SYMMI|nr:hypothetical protein AK812_SmicGene19663 [Symbiodinium microadriaticum]